MIIERKILIGAIVSTDFLKRIRDIWDVRFFKSGVAKRLAHWTWEYFEKYDKAPKQEIETIFYQKLWEDKLPEEIAKEIEEDILPGLSDEYSREKINIEYLVDLTIKYFRERKLEIFSESIKYSLINGNIDEAEKLVYNYKSNIGISDESLDFRDNILLEKVERAFNNTDKVLISFPDPFGFFVNNQLVNGGFVAFLAPEKRGKTWILIEMAMRALEQGHSVAFFQAGDMTESQMIKRISSYLAKKPYLKKYCGTIYEPVRDCVYNQLNECKRSDRICDFGIFEGKDSKWIRKEVTIEDIIKAYEDFPDYRPCCNCMEYYKNNWGAVWIETITLDEPLKSVEAKNIMDKFFIEGKRPFKLSTHPNGTLSVKKIEDILSIWEKKDDFIPEVIIIDYADLLESPEREFRHKQNEIWKGLRRLSQERGQPLVITATQSDADSYDRDRLRMSNFSEDKRKYGHVTAMWGLNQDTEDREKKLGIMRINEIVIREGEFFTNSEVTILQNLKCGRPFLGSFL